MLGSPRGTKAIELPALSPNRLEEVLWSQPVKIRSPSLDPTWLKLPSTKQGRYRESSQTMGELKESRLVWVMVSEGIC